MQHQETLFEDAPCNDVDIVKDDINRRFGKMALKPAALVGKNQQWEMRRNYLSFHYTTDWNHLIEAG